MRRAITLQILTFGFLFVAKGKCDLESEAYKRALDIAYGLQPALPLDDLDSSLSEIHPFFMFAPPTNKNFAIQQRPRASYASQKPDSKSHRPLFKEQVFSESHPTLQYGFVPHMPRKPHGRKFIAQATELQPHNSYNNDMMGRNPKNFAPIPSQKSFLQIPMHKTIAIQKSHPKNNLYLRKLNMQEGFTHKFISVARAPPNFQPLQVQEHVQQPVHAITQQYHHQQHRPPQGKPPSQQIHGESFQHNTRPNNLNLRHVSDNNVLSQQNTGQHQRAISGNRFQSTTQQRFVHKLNKIEGNRGIHIFHTDIHGREPTKIRVDDILDIHKNLPSFLGELNSKSRPEDKKTYLIFKAPTLVTTPRPASAPYSTGRTHHISPLPKNNEYPQQNPIDKAPYTPSPPVFHVQPPTAKPRPLPPRPLQPPKLNTLVIDLVPISPEPEGIRQMSHSNALTETEAPVLNQDPIPASISISSDQDAYTDGYYQPAQHFLPSSLITNADTNDAAKIPAGYYNFEDHFQPLTHSQYSVSSGSTDRNTPVADSYYNYIPTEPQNSYGLSDGIVIPAPNPEVSTSYVNHSSPASVSVSVDSYQNLASPAVRSINKPSNSSFYSLPIPANQKPTQKRQPKASSKKSKVSKQKSKHYPKYDGGSDLYDNDNVPGRPGSDYPVYNEIPFTNFECGEFKSPGFYADLEAGCQVFHNCDMGMKKHSFMCPNGTIFRQELFICDWWYNVRCDDSPEFYGLNGGLYDEDPKRQKSTT